MRFIEFIEELDKFDSNTDTDNNADTDNIDVYTIDINMGINNYDINSIDIDFELI